MRDYSKFYTPYELSRLLVENCHSIKPKTVIDICAGSWNLLNAAFARWPEAILTGVDIEETSKKSIIADGRIYSHNLTALGNQYDLVLANPPYQYERPTSEILEIIDERFGHYKFGGYVSTRLESTMMLFNSLLVRPGGILAAIVPETIITSQHQIALRKYLANEFSLEKVIHLPDSAFGKRERLHTSIIILRRVRSYRDTKVVSATWKTSGYVTEELHSIPTSLVKQGQWTSNSSSKAEQPECVGFSIVRNNISSNILTQNKKDNSIPVIHSSAISGAHSILHHKLSYVSPETKSLHYTSLGDLAVIRVGKSCGMFATIGRSETEMLTSDCILLIKPVNSIIREKIICHLSQRPLEHLKRGVAARYITKQELEFYCRTAIEGTPNNKAYL